MLNRCFPQGTVRFVPLPRLLRRCIALGKSRYVAFVHPNLDNTLSLRTSSTASSSRWKARQTSDHFVRQAKVAGLKSRAAFKLLQINDKHKIFRRGATVVDLGYAPGSWSQVAFNRTAPGGRVVGVDILPAQPPRGVSTIQGDFLSPEIQAEVRRFVQDPMLGRLKEPRVFSKDQPEASINGPEETYEGAESAEEGEASAADAVQEEDAAQGRVVDVVLSDMSEPWGPPSDSWKRSINEPYFRLMNTSGMPFRDHAGSMDLCNAALAFCFDTLRPGGHFVCKFYQGAEDKLLEKRLKRLFEKVSRDKPEASRAESREGYFVALRRKAAPKHEDVFAD